MWNVRKMSEELAATIPIAAMDARLPADNCRKGIHRVKPNHSETVT